MKKTQTKWNSYQDYLKSNEWKKLKEKFYKGFEYDIHCEICHDMDFSYNRKETHHFKYPANYNYANDSIDNLICVCRKCHEDIHNTFIKDSNSALHYYLSIFLSIKNPNDYNYWDGSLWKNKKDFIYNFLQIKNCVTQEENRIKEELISKEKKENHDIKNMFNYHQLKAKTDDEIFELKLQVSSLLELKKDLDKTNHLYFALKGFVYNLIKSGDVKLEAKVILNDFGNNNLRKIEYLNGVDIENHDFLELVTKDIGGCNG